MTVGKNGTLVACGLLFVPLVATGVSLDLAFGTRVIFTLAAFGVATLYLTYTVGPSAPFVHGLSGRRRQAGRFALTFDDGPDPRYTSTISKLLAARGHRATFFVLGGPAERYPEVVAQVAQDGHEVAVHGYDHRTLAFSLPATVRRQIAMTEAAVVAATGRRPAGLFRAPHGVRSLWLARTAAGIGYRLCGWDGRIFDTANPGAEIVVARVQSELRPGAVILLHDGDGSGHRALRHQTVRALPAILDDAEARGLHSVPLSTLLPMVRAPTFAAEVHSRASTPHRRPPTV